MGEQHDARRELGVNGIEAGIVEIHGAAIFHAEKRRHRGALVVEKPQPGPARRGQGPRDLAEERLHALVHEARLADLGETVEPEELGERLLPSLGRSVGAHGRAGQLALELAYLALELVAILAGQPLQIGLPRGGQLEDRTAIFSLDRSPQP